MSEQHFNVAKWGFWLVAFVIGAHVFAVLIAEMACLYHAEAIIDGKTQCDANGKLGEMLAAALAAALAFAGGQRAGEAAARKRVSDDEEVG